MRITPSLNVAIIFCSLTITSVAQEVVIDSFDTNGKLTWTTTETGSTFQVQWASSLTGTWNNSWGQLARIEGGTNTSLAASVPMFYRVVQPAPAQPLTITPSSVTLTNESELVVFEVRGGTEPFTWHVTNSGVGGIVGNNVGASVIYERYSVGENVVTVVDNTGAYKSVVVHQP